MRADWKGTADLRREIQDAGFRRGLRTSGRLYCKFVVTDTTGNTAIAGTLSVTGVTTVTGATALNGGLTLDSNKFGPRLADEAIRELVEYTRTQAANGWAS